MKLKIICLCFFSILICGCSKSPIDLVKDGTFSSDKSVTIGNVLNTYEYFKNKKWTFFEDKQKRKVVEFDGVIDREYLLSSDSIDNKAKKWLYNIFQNESSHTAKKEIKLVLQFLINVDGKAFQLVYVHIGYDNDMICLNRDGIIVDILKDKYPSCVYQYFTNNYIRYMAENAGAELNEAEKKKGSISFNLQVIL